MQAKQAVTTCEYCARPSVWTAYREVGFGVTVTIAKVCTRHKKQLEGRN